MTAGEMRDAESYSGLRMWEPMLWVSLTGA